MDREIYDRMRGLEQSHWWFTARREILTSELARLKLPADARILEVGAGTGGNLEMLSRFGRVEAIEPDDESRAYAAERTGVKVQGGLLPDGLPKFETPFDLICAFDVIEHVDDDAGSLNALGRLLKPRGWLVTTVPAHQWMWSAHDEAHHHKRRYTLGRYRDLVAATGLKIRRASYFNAVLFPPIAAVRIAKSALGKTGGDDDAMPSAPINKLLHGLFASESALLKVGDLPFGVSILVVAQAADA